jgi:transcriptional pleiotropic regulator of transition state genes
MARKVDDLGRIVLPVELRRLHDIHTGDALEISVDGDAIVLRKISNSCVFCNGVEALTTYRERSICAVCREGLKTSVATQPSTPVVSAH